ncbi:MAG TPA: ABC transporter ATP-binding protein [Conexibacter sp.]|nr:ABC transporter ATP-binding protein [Conexibacter sp.]
MRLVIENVSKRFAGVHALREVSLTAGDGRVVGIIGPNGSGKSTLFNVISGFLRADDGTVRLEDAAITSRAPHKIARAGLVRTFQVPHVAKRLTVMDNLMFGAPGHRNERVWSALLGRRRADRFEQEATVEAFDVAETVGLAPKADEYAGNLSGGQLKLLSLGMAMMARPQVLLLDEPTAGVNPSLIGRLIDPVFERRPVGQTIVLIEHNMDLITSHCDEVYVLDAGRVIAHGTPDDVRRDERVVQAYLGYEGAKT